MLDEVVDCRFRHPAVHPTHVNPLLSFRAGKKDALRCSLYRNLQRDGPDAARDDAELRLSRGALDEEGVGGLEKDDRADSVDFEVGLELLDRRRDDQTVVLSDSCEALVSSRSPSQNGPRTSVGDHDVQLSRLRPNLLDRSLVVLHVGRSKLDDVNGFRLLLREGLESSGGSGVARAGEDDGVGALGEGLDETEADAAGRARDWEGESVLAKGRRRRNVLR